MTNSLLDCYFILEVSPTATDAEIKASYRRLVLLHHPDKNDGSQAATLKMQKINGAWEILGDPAARCSYNSRYQPWANTTSHSYSNTDSNAPRTHSYSEPPKPSQAERFMRKYAKRRANCRRQRQKWLDYERMQEHLIRISQDKVRDMNLEINALCKRIASSKEKLGSDFPPGENKLELEIINYESALRVKQTSLKSQTSRLDLLRRQLSQRRVDENDRLEAERYMK
ncbi:DnaJ domain-containing protein [Dendryphion nanum]|uniref:DnaJ domain-containing protein n=1 Tax=Dendryphion nanum TaxID=256645 RepID=A0A9P9INB9_9PLEO|nr:DnaJ domain-containing protein [Dendryphion nanum]